MLGWLPLPPGHVVDADGDPDVLGWIGAGDNGPLSWGRALADVGTCAVGTTAVPGGVTDGITPVGTVAVGWTADGRGRVVVGRGRVVVGLGREVVVVGLAVVVVGFAVADLVADLVAAGVVHGAVLVTVTVTVAVGVGVLTWTVGSSPGKVAAVGSTVAGWVSGV